tara:strand:+ start:1106 stop:2149 length:1044 start_codon:yes stop_codon:yes gene_type:complete
MFEKKKLKIPLDEFINNALYHPKFGYYMQKISFEKDGDFITAPNISKIFSEMILIWLVSAWKKIYKNKRINIVELGAGNGDMMYQIVYSSKRFIDFHKKCNFIIFEKSPKLIKVQKEKLKNEKIKWLKNLDNLNNNPTIFLGNEFLDALPIKQYVKRKNIWYEKYIIKNGRTYSFSHVKCNIKKIEKNLGFKISSNQNFLEISFEEIKILKKLNNIILKKGGSILLIDYAYLKNKMSDTLQAVKKHKKVSILNNVGNSDITHLINIPFLKKIAKKLNLELNYNTQRDFLLDLGILNRAEILASNKNFLDKANIFYRINRLIDKKQMGVLFKVMYFHKKTESFKLGFK